MRGKVGYRSRSFLTFRITPAYAGKRLQMKVTLLPVRDHPRLCGEKYMQESDVSVDSGITPAYAGKSVRTLRNSHHDQDHPRLCGEKFFCAYSRVSQSGSPPPMRGKGCPRLDTCDIGRITPAYAGKS